MKKLICCVLISLVFCVTANNLFATDDDDLALKPPMEVAKEYVAKKYDCDIDDFSIGDSMIDRGGAYIDVNHGYDTESVTLIRQDFESDWKVAGSEPTHQY